MDQRHSTLTRARAAANKGRFGVAIDLCEQLLATSPEDADAHGTLGRILAHVGRADEGLIHLRRAADLRPTDASARHALAQHLAAVGRFGEALEAFESVRRLAPGIVSAHVDAAALLEMHARTDEARRAIDDALAIEPMHAPARIAAIRMDLRSGEPEPGTLESWREALRHMADTADAPTTRASALDVLVDVSERLGAFEGAWRAIEELNEVEAVRAGRALPDGAAREAYLASIEAMAGAMTPEDAARWRDERPDDGLPAPALLVGFPRSGTTLTERALDAHPGVRSIEEMATFEHVRRHAESILPPALAVMPPERVMHELLPEHVSALREAYWARVSALLGLDGPPEGMLVLDKLPLRITALPLVNRIFPEARVLVALRDPRDVCLSCYRQSFTYAGRVGMSFFLRLRDTARLYAAVMGGYLRNRDAYTNPTLEVRYEETVADFEGRIGEMLEFLGLEFDPAVRSAHERRDRLHATPSYHAVQRPVTAGAVGRWRRYETQLAPIAPVLEPLVRELGYE